MKKEIRKTYVDKSFGFPVVLQDVPIIVVQGMKVPDIDFSALAQSVLEELCIKQSFLTGNEVRFLRNHFGFTQRAFAARFGVSQPAVIKWEKKCDQPTKMQWSTEKDLRLFIGIQLGKKPKEVGQLYGLLEKQPGKSNIRMKISKKRLKSHR